MKGDLKFSKDVYKKSFEDFEVFVKGKYPKVGKKEIKRLYEAGQ